MLTPTLRRALSLLLLGFSLALLPAPQAHAQVASSQSDANPRRLTLTGHGIVKVKPDVADITLGVVTEGKSPQLASDANAKLAAKVQDALKHSGVAAKDIQTSAFTMETITGERKTHKGTETETMTTGYRVINQVAATVRDLSKLGDVLSVAIRAGANSVQDVTLRLANTQPMNDEALKRAMADARRKADVIASAAGAHIVGVLEINETQVQAQDPFQGAFNNSARNYPAAGTTVTSVAPIAVGQLTITADVTIVYQMGP